MKWFSKTPAPALKWFHLSGSEYSYCHNLQGLVVGYVERRASGLFASFYTNIGTTETRLDGAFVSEDFAKAALEEYLKTHEAELVK